MGVTDLVGDNKNPILTVPAALFSLPYAAVSGGFEGVYFGAKNSWDNSETKPFSKDAFSLGELK